MMMSWVDDWISESVGEKVRELRRTRGIRERPDGARQPQRIRYPDRYSKTLTIIDSAYSLPDPT